jgi:hypothetical protein
MMKRLSAALVMVCLIAGGAQAATKLGEHDNWIAWEDTDATGKICYISSAPQKFEPSDVLRDPIHFLVTHRQGTGKRNEVATNLGYPTNDDEDASATIDGRSYPLVTDTDTEAGWLAAEADEPGFVEAMKAGSELVVKAVSARGTHTIDTYSLVGATAAMQQIDEACPPE